MNAGSFKNKQAMLLQQIKERYGARNSSIELFRLVAMFGIVLIHTFGHGSGLDKKAFHSALVNWLASSTLAIYLITDSGGLRNYIMPWLLDNVMATPLLGYSMMVIVCLACLMIDKVRTVFVTPLNKGIEKVFQYSKERIKCI